jgi:hypothetical protein
MFAATGRRPPSEKFDRSAIDLPRALRAELRRVGCNSGTVDGNWTASSQKALELFNKHAGLKLDVKAASVDAAVEARTGRICPLICETGFRADSEKCVKITCRKGYEPHDEGTCEKIEVRKPIAKRDEPKAKRVRAERNAASPAKPQASGQIVCGHGGCRQVRPGYRIVGARSGFGVTTARRKNGSVQLMQAVGPARSPAIIPRERGCRVPFLT